MYSTELAIFILMGVFVGCMLVRVPITFSIMISSFSAALYMGMSPTTVVLNMVQGLRNFSLLAIPFFILMGEIMGPGGISDKIVLMANAIIGRVRGGLAMVNCIDSMFFGGISGSVIADVSSLGSIVIPMMKKQGYDEGFSVGITVASACQSALIPPSHNMVMYAIMAGVGVTVGDVFLAGLFPGIMLGLILTIFCYIIAKIKKFPISDYISPRDRIKAIGQGIVPMFTIIIIMGGVALGIFTATESAAIACIYAFLLTFVVYKKIPLRGIFPIFRKSLRTLAMVLCLIASASAFASIMARLQVPALITNLLLSISDNKYVVFFLINIMLLVLGTIMDMAPLILIATPVLLPVVTSFGMDPVHFGVVLIYNLSIGLCTPPVGTALFTGCAIGKVSIEKASKALIPIYIPMLIGLFLITYVPIISMWLPTLMKS